jgi:cell division protein FtsI (penicillin-binding protein 3)
MTQYRESREPSSSKKIVFIFFIIIFAIIIVFLRFIYVAIADRDMPSIYTSDREKAKRGSIISSDNYNIVYTKKLYKASVNTLNIPLDKQELFAKMFAIYSGEDKEVIYNKIRSRRGSTKLSYRIDPKSAQRLKELGKELISSGIFKSYKSKEGKDIMHGLSIQESGAAREYPYKDTLTPIIGYFKKYEESYYTRVKGVKGIEKYYEDLLKAQRDGRRRGLRDVVSNMLYNGELKNIVGQNGLNVHLNINLSLQKKVEELISRKQKELNAKEILVAIMESKTGKILTLASSNRFNPKNLRNVDYAYLNANVIEYNFEPGSVLKPIVFSLLLDKKKIKSKQLVNCENGRYKIGGKKITDEHKLGWVEADQIIIHSSNIGMAKLSQKLDVIDYYQGLQDFGFSKKSGIELPYEKKGRIPEVAKLAKIVYRASTSYGYGITVNFMQLIKAYNVFNNNGILITPKLVSHFTNSKGQKVVVGRDNDNIPKKVISKRTSSIIRRILIDTVRKGTGKVAKTSGIEIGGKTGTAHIARRGRYINKYNSSFLGFANGKKHRYTIGVTVVEAKKGRYSYYASKSAVPVFKSVIDLMIDDKFLQRRGR